MKKSLGTYLLLLIIFVVLIGIVAKFSGPVFLKSYVKTGMGTCQKMHILCLAPIETINNRKIDKEYIKGLIPYEFPKFTISLPRGFSVIQETIKKVYYKKEKRESTDKVCFAMHQPPNFFVSLFPQLAKKGVDSDYEFIKRTMYASENQIKNLQDVFFVIMKSIFIPDLGDQKKVKMVEFEIGNMKGFINYNISNEFFDCNVINEAGGFFKLYIRDKSASLNLNNVLDVIATIIDTS
jgi:hypothetical protein